MKLSLSKIALKGYLILRYEHRIKKAPHRRASVKTESTQSDLTDLIEAMERIDRVADPEIRKKQIHLFAIARDIDPSRLQHLFSLSQDSRL